MNILKPFTLFIILSMVPVYGFSQWIGFHGGPDGTDILVRDTAKNNLYSPVAGFRMGPVFEFRIKRSWTLETGVSLSSGGAFLKNKAESGNEVYDIGASIRTWYMEIPLISRVYIPLDKRLAILFLGGISGSRGIGGLVTYTEFHNGNKQVESAKVEWGKNPDLDDFKPFNLCAVAGIGTHYRRYQFTIQYTRGITDISPYTDRDVKMVTHSLFLALHYKYTWKRKLIMPFFEDVNDVYPWTKL
jgi:hypothetical protein